MRSVLVALLLILPVACSGETPQVNVDLTTTAAASAIPAASTTDWPQWRGPNRDGKSTETGLLREWPSGGPKLLWSARDVNKGTNVGSGMSSLAIAHNRIYTMGDRDGGGNLIALDLATGKILWATKVSPEKGGDGPAGGRCTPTIDGNRAYVLSPHGILSCVDAIKGGLLWQKDFKKDFKGHMMSGWNYSESPTIDVDKIVVTPGGKTAAMVALNKITGDVIWKCAAPKDAGAGYASIVIAEVGGTRQYITLMGPQLGLIGVDAYSGKFLWNYTKVAGGTANIPTPIVHGDFVFASTGYNVGAALLKLVSDGNGGVKAEQQYFLDGRKNLQNHHGGMVMIGDYIYGGHGHNDGQPFCLDWKAGKLKWGPESGAGSGSAAVLYADGHLYFRWDNNVVGLVEATPKGYHLVSKFQLPKDTSRPGWQHPVIHDGKLYIRGNDQVLCYDIKQR